MSTVEDYYRQLRSGPLRYTTARWYNDFSEGVQGPGGEWIVKPPKKPAFKGSYDQFRYGRDHPSTWTSIHHLQPSLICCPTSWTIGVDVDHPELFDTTRTARLIGRAQAISTVSERYHVAVDWREALVMGEFGWPRQTPIRGADIKSRGFIPVPGCVHYTGQLYQPVPGAVAVPWTRELAGAIFADQEDEKARRKAEMDRLLAGVNEIRATLGLPSLTGRTGNGGGHDGQVAAACMGMIIKRLRKGWEVSPELKEDVYDEWCEIAIPHDPARPFDRGDFERHYGDERRGGLAEALNVIAADAEMHRLLYERGGYAWAEEATRQARQLPRPVGRAGREARR
jgi:hypothetical protein